MSGGTTSTEGAALTRVLVVDDDRIAERLAARDAFHPLTEQSVEDAVDRVQREQVDCVVTTARAGLDPLRELRDAGQTVPVLVVVSEAGETTVGEALEAGADDVLLEGNVATDSLLVTRIRNAVAGARADRAEPGAPQSGADSDDRLPASSGTALFENVGSPVAYIEYADDRPVILDVNPAFAETFGVDRGGVAGRTIDDLVASSERRAEAVALSERFREKSPGSVEVVRDTVDGPRPFLLRLARVDEAERDRLFATYVDVSERKRREDELEELNDRISSLHEAANRLLTAEDRSTVYEETVRAAIDILEFDWCVTSRPVDGRFELTAASEESPFEVGDAPLAVGEGTSGRAFETGESDLTNDMQADSRGEPADDAIRSGLTVPIGEFGIFQAVSTEPDAFDETDRELAELLVAHTQEALHWFERTDELERQNERLEQFASAVSHDLRNPLNVAQGRLHLARESGDVSELEAAERALDRMNSIIEDVLALARETPEIDLEPVEIASAARTAWSMVDTGAASLSVDVEGARLADPGRLQRLFENLFRNSVEHGDAEAVRIESIDDGFAVVDDGTGFDDAEVALTSGQSSNGGTGLGLAIVQRIAEAHGWTVTTANGENGARVEFRGVERAD